MLIFIKAKVWELGYKPFVSAPMVACILSLFASSAAMSAGALGVSELTQATLAHHPALRGASAKAEAAQLSVDAAKWQFWPTPSIGFERLQSGRQDGVQGDKGVGVFRLQQPLWTGGRLTAGFDKAQSAFRQAEAEQGEVKQALATRVIQSWSEAVVALRKLEAQAKSLERHQRLLEMVDRRLSEGASALSDSALARSRIELLQSEISLLQAQRDQALDRLRLLTGKRISATDLAWAHQPQLVARRTLDELIEQAKAISPQLKKVRQTTDVARADVDLAKAALLPEVLLRFEHQSGNLNVANASSTSRVFVTLNSNLGAGLSSLSGVNVAVAQLSAAQEQIAEQEQALVEQVQSDFTLVQAAEARLRGLSFATKASSDVLDSYERQFLAGRKQWLDLMNAAREQAQTESQLADAMGALELSSLRLVLLTAGVDALLQARPAATVVGGRP